LEKSSLYICADEKGESGASKEKIRSVVVNAFIRPENIFKDSSGGDFCNTLAGNVSTGRC
jgi:hypothetical protein